MSQKHAEQVVAQLVEEAWATAELRGDAAFLESTLADDFVGIGPLGFMLTKQEWIGRHQIRRLKVRIAHAGRDERACVPRYSPGDCSSSAAGGLSRKYH